MDKEKLYNLIG